MAGLVPAIHVCRVAPSKNADVRHMGEPTGPARSGRPDDKLRDAVLRAALAGHDGKAHFPNRSALKGLGSQNGVAPVIISAINRPVAGPSVSPQWPCPNASQSPR